MCGIVGYVGKKNCLKTIIDGIKALEYRGYDSVGIAYFGDDNISIIKDKGRIMDLEKKIDTNIKTKIGIGHTRWATHGEPSKVNAHPHRVNKITLVHNGIIENYDEIRTELIKYGYEFKSDTDTEVLCAYIDYLYSKNNDMIKSLSMLKDKIKGSYATCILCSDDKEHLYIVKKGSPLILGTSNDEYIIASDIAAIIDKTKRYMILDDDEIGIISSNGYEICDSDLKVIKKDILTFDKNIDKISKDGYDHFMLKEIYEEDDLIKKTLSYYLNNDLLKDLPDLSKYKEIYIVGCGSAYNASLVGKYYIENYLNIPVYVEIASEFRYKKLFINDKSLVIAISQSGETADTIEAVNIAKKYGAKTIGIVNTYKSTIARISDEVIYINAGIEVAVATTKAYSLQVLYLILLSLRNKEIDKNIINKISNDIKEVYEIDYKELAKKISNKEHIFFIGRGIDYYLAIEGSLKLKEISYIHAECYAAGELKHGTISLIDKGTPVISVITNKDISSKTISNIKEVKARGAYVILVCTDDIVVDKDIYDDIIIVPSDEVMSPILSIIGLQLLSYYVAKDKGCDIDKPRNLAKSVTVE